MHHIPTINIASKYSVLTRYLVQCKSEGHLIQIIKTEWRKQRTDQVTNSNKQWIIHSIINSTGLQLFFPLSDRLHWVYFCYLLALGPLVSSSLCQRMQQMLRKHLVTITFLCIANGINAKKGKGRWGRLCSGWVCDISYAFIWNLFARLAIAVWGTDLKSLTVMGQLWCCYVPMMQIFQELAQLLLETRA